MDYIKQIIAFIVLTAVSLCFILMHSRTFGVVKDNHIPQDNDTPVITQIQEPQGSNSQPNRTNIFVADSRLDEKHISVDAGFRVILQFYEKYSTKTIPETSSIENAYGTEDKYLCFALNNGILDFHSYKNLNVPLTRQTAVSMIYALINHKDMQSIDKSSLNMIKNIPDLLPYSDIHDKALMLSGMGIVECEADGSILGDKYVTYSYLANLLKRIEYPELRKHRFVNDTLHEENKPYCVILQNPELPTGCEVTALASVLNHIGFDIDKVTLAENYLDKGEIGSTDFMRAFVGDPSYYDSYGCYAPVIVNCANKYLSSQGSIYRARDLTGTEFCNLYGYLDKGIPVIVWATMNLVKSYPSEKWIIGKREIVWTGEEHCMVLYGYDAQKDTLFVADPLIGNVEYNRSLFEERYNELFKQAVIIK